MFPIAHFALGTTTAEEADLLRQDKPSWVTAEVTVGGQIVYEQGKLNIEVRGEALTFDADV